VACGQEPPSRGATKRRQPGGLLYQARSFDPAENLYLVDIPFGRVFQFAPDVTWSIEFDGWHPSTELRILPIPQSKIATAKYANVDATIHCDLFAGVIGVCRLIRTTGQHQAQHKQAGRKCHHDSQ
jgi:hypothetical protein